MTEKELLQRTKRFALRVIKLVEALPKTVTERQLPGSLFGPELLLLRIIEQLAAVVQNRSLLQNLGSLKKRRTRAHFGWN